MRAFLSCLLAWDVEGLGMERCNNHVNSARFGYWISFGLEPTSKDILNASSIRVNPLSPVLDFPL